jgi:Fic family protein
MAYNWEQKDWPDFKYNLEELEDAILAFTEETGHITGILKGISPDKQSETLIQIMVSEAMKTSEIEGEYLSRPDVLSSIRNKLGVNKIKENIKDKNSAAAGELMVAVRKTYSTPLTEKDLLAWHQMLMKQNQRIIVGSWRKHKEPMQVISGAIGKEKIHFEAPPSSRIPSEMRKFIKWFNETGPGGKKEIKKAPIRSAITHLYFESIHPFEDGNGRIGRALAEKALSQTLGRPVFLSLSQSIESNKKMYYKSLENAQKSNAITSWIIYFVNVILDAQKQTKILIELTLKKTKIFDRFKNQLNDRQLKVIKKMLDAEPKGFEGGMTAKKYMSITKASKPTATRDLQDLVILKILLAKGSGRNTHYEINLNV